MRKPYRVLLVTVSLYAVTCLSTWLLGGGINDLRTASLVAVGIFVVVAYTITGRPPPAWLSRLLPGSTAKRVEP